MSVQIEALFTSALGLQQPWAVREVRLDTARHRIDFDVECKQALLACPACGAASQKVHDRLTRSWRHLDFFQFEAWLHAEAARWMRGLRQDHADQRAVGSRGQWLHTAV